MDNCLSFNYFKYCVSVSVHLSVHIFVSICVPRQVQPGGKSKAALNDMRSLSGGERSFSTVCFVLSLWSITESPFRALDEFDVYMVCWSLLS